MAAKRLAAIVAAVLLVVAAIGARRWLDTGGEVSLGGTPSAVYCDPLVADACRQAFAGRQIIVEAPGVTLDRLIDARDASPLLWVTDQHWIDVLETERDRLGRSAVLGSVERDLAHSDVVLVSSGGLDSACGANITWACVAMSLDGTDIGFDNRNTTVGLLARGSVTAGFIGTPSFATNDIDAGVRSWQAGFDRDLTELASTRRALDEMLTVRGRFQLVTAAAVDWARLSRSGFEAVTPSDSGPAITIALAVVGDAGGRSDDLGAALVDSGWQAGPGPERIGPSPGVLESLRSAS
ncbi:MAG: hypothetical protein ACI8TP_002462 [Acidimicrobiales bacterium]|jgi:hypothetical protein